MRVLKPDPITFGAYFLMNFEYWLVQGPTEEHLKVKWASCRSILMLRMMTTIIIIIFTDYVWRLWKWKETSGILGLQHWYSFINEFLMYICISLYRPIFLLVYLNHVDWFVKSVSVQQVIITDSGQLFTRVFTFVSNLSSGVQYYAQDSKFSVWISDACVGGKWYHKC